MRRRSGQLTRGVLLPDVVALYEALPQVEHPRFAWLRRWWRW